MSQSMEFIMRWMTLSPFLIPFLSRTFANRFTPSSNCFQVISLLLFSLGTLSIRATSFGYNLAFLAKISPMWMSKFPISIPPFLRFRLRFRLRKYFSLIHGPQCNISQKNQQNSFFSFLLLLINKISKEGWFPSEERLGKKESLCPVCYALCYLEPAFAPFVRLNILIRPERTGGCRAQIKFFHIRIFP